MTNSEKPEGDLCKDHNLGTTYDKIINYAQEKPTRWVLVDTNKQHLFLVREGVVLARWPVSTALVGLDNRENSGGTPTGVHRVSRKIGAGFPLGTVFLSRQPTGETWSQEWNNDELLLQRDLILSRILVLDGLEPGVNLGPGVDSRERYIYVHGTNREDLIGQPVSHGCVRMNNQAIIELFELIKEGDPLVIV